MKHLRFCLWILLAIVGLDVGSAQATKEKCEITQRPNKKGGKKNEKEEPGKTCSDKGKKLGIASQCTSLTEATHACCCGDPEGGSPKDNKGDDKKGDDKKDDKKGGGDGKMPEMKMPEMPPKKEEKKEDLAAKEKARQAQIAACKANVANNLETKKRNCESRFPFNKNFPVQDMKQKQDECKQNEIFGSQTDMNNCELSNPGSGAVSSSLTSTSQTETQTQIVTNTITSTNTSTK